MTTFLTDEDKKLVESLKQHEYADQEESIQLADLIEKLCKSLDLAVEALPCDCDYDEQCSYCFVEDQVKEIMGEGRKI
jgi:hypothetical protein